ncbi:Helix-turn-helix domain-containing protein [Nonomuraea solani]|uniref:Helix-turn-helix domain-containing protein n=1 Tax=Nonomuraea solani TaxID=1144553 RepID=A0A1H6ET17_9ACTN|nr:helix-turn-helix domain-containing protein [Nonomuraea solani]SEH00952.1 Helix-turn-helix domain-containing protein [Nonomuraea solani]
MPKSAELGALLTLLKERSGHSYQSIGRVINASKSAVHRYCTGHSLPPEFGVVERIARVCGARPDELSRLYRLWEAAVLSAQDAQDTQNAQDLPDEPVAEPVAEPVPAPVGRAAPRHRAGALAMFVGLLAVMALILAPSGGRVVPARSPVNGGPAVPGIWTLPAAPVPATLFGVTINSATGAMPGFRVGAVRLWDSGTLWAHLQPHRGAFDWSVLDRLVNGARRAGRPVLFVMGGTPQWASPNGRIGPYPGGSRTSPPDRLADWDGFVTGLATRYRGRIEAYELWVLANDPRFYSGSMETLVEMTRRASRIIRSVDPSAVLVCPGMGRLWSADGRASLRRFAELGGFDHCDVAGIKLHQRQAGDPPETMLELAATADRAFHEAGVHPRLWSTGTTYDIPLQGKLEETKARNHAVRFYLTGLYARHFNLERMYFYNWGGTKIPIVLQAVGRPPTAAARAVEELQRWLAHARHYSCGHGAAIGLPANVWRCQFAITQPGRSREAAVLWTDSGTATITTPVDIEAVRRLDGGVAAVRAGYGLRVGEEPVLVEPARQGRSRP